MVRSYGGASWFYRKDSAWRRSRPKLQLTDHRHPLPEACLKDDLICANYDSRRSRTIDLVAIVPMGKCDGLIEMT